MDNTAKKDTEIDDDQLQQLIDEAEKAAKLEEQRTKDIVKQQKINRLAELQ